MTRCWSTGIPIYEKLHEVGEIVISRSNHWRAKYQRTHVPGQTGSWGCGSAMRPTMSRFGMKPNSRRHEDSGDKATTVRASRSVAGNYGGPGVLAGVSLDPRPGHHGRMLHLRVNGDGAVRCEASGDNGNLNVHRKLPIAINHDFRHCNKLWHSALTGGKIGISVWKLTGRDRAAAAAQAGAPVPTWFIYNPEECPSSFRLRPPAAAHAWGS